MGRMVGGMMMRGGDGVGGDGAGGDKGAGGDSFDTAWPKQHDSSFGPIGSFFCYISCFCNLSNYCFCFIE